MVPASKPYPRGQAPKTPRPDQARRRSTPAEQAPEAALPKQVFHPTLRTEREKSRPADEAWESRRRAYGSRFRPPGTWPASPASRLLFSFQYDRQIDTPEPSTPSPRAVLSPQHQALHPPPGCVHSPSFATKEHPATTNSSGVSPEAWALSRRATGFGQRDAPDPRGVSIHRRTPRLPAPRPPPTAKPPPDTPPQPNTPPESPSQASHSPAQGDRGIPVSPIGQYT